MVATRILDRLAHRLATELAPPRVPLVPWVVDGGTVGHLDARRVALLERWPQVFVLAADHVGLSPALRDAAARTDALAGVARALDRLEELSPWRDEWYAVAAHQDAMPLFLLERSAARFFGIRTVAVHVNGIVERDGAPCMWIARRSPYKAIDPGRLDNLVGGGVPAGAGIMDTLVKEAFEEAGIEAPLARTALAAGCVEIRRVQPDGLQHEIIHVHDLTLPPEFVPVNQDGEVVDFRCVTMTEAALLAGNESGEDVVTADASLVIADCLARRGAFASSATALATLGALRCARSPCAVS